LTVILVVTHSTDLSADLVIRHLRNRRVDFLRLDTNRLGTPECHFSFEDGPTLRIDGRTIAQLDCGAIWARRFARPAAEHGLDVRYREFVRRENSVVMDAFLETAACFQMNPYMADRLAGNRLVQSQRAAAVGLTVPSSCVTQDVSETKAFLEQHPRTVIKALSFGRLTDGSDATAYPVAYTSVVSPDTDWSGLAVAPVLLQARVDGHFEWRVTTVGERVFSARTASQVGVDWRNQEAPPPFEIATLPVTAENALLALCRDSGIFYGAHDLIETPEGEFVFLETNPAGQWGWLEAALDLPIGKAIADELVVRHG